MNRYIDYSMDITPFFNEVEKNYRVGVWTCPLCGENDNDGTWDWMDSNHVEAVILHPKKYYKLNSALIISKCEHCGEFSWHHIDLKKMLHDDDIFDEEIVNEEIERRETTALNNWKNSYCCTCENLHEVDVHWYIFHRECESGMGPPCCEECPLYRHCDDIVLVKMLKRFEAEFQVDRLGYKRDVSFILWKEAQVVGRLQPNGELVVKKEDREFILCEDMFEVIWRCE